jgi:hypothetical protein
MKNHITTNIFLKRQQADFTAIACCHCLLIKVDNVSKFLGYDKV